MNGINKLGLVIMLGVIFTVVLASAPIDENDLIATMVLAISFFVGTSLFFTGKEDKGE